MDISGLHLNESDLDGLDFSSLQTLESLEQLNKEFELDYDRSAYPDKEDMLQYIKIHKDEIPTVINLGMLSLNGICVQDEMETYLSVKRVSSSNKKEALNSPFSFLVSYHEMLQPKNADYFELGTFAHMAFLEPWRFDKVAVAPDVSLVTKEGVIRMINFYQSLIGQRISIFSQDRKIDDLRKILSFYQKTSPYQVIAPEHKIIIDLLRRNYYTYGGGIIPHIFKGALTEVSMYGTDEYGIDVKIRPDFINIEENVGVNLIGSIKTTRVKSIGQFMYDCARLKYEVSEGMYQQVASNITGINFNATVMIMLQTVPPFQTAVIWWTPEDIEVGKYKSNIASSIIAECFEKNIYPGFDAKAPAGDNGIYDSQLPNWAKTEEHPTSIEEE